MKLFSRPVAILACLAVALGPVVLASSASAVTASKASAGTILAQLVTTLTVTLPKVLPPGQGFVASARLVRTGNVPVARQAVMFTQTGIAMFAPRKAVTDAAGIARMTMIGPKVGPLTVSAYFAGSPSLAPSKGSASTVVSRSATTLTVTLPSFVLPGRPLIASARLVRAGGVPVAGQVVTFTQTGISLFVVRKAVTDAAGIARMTIIASRVGPLTVSASFAGSPTLAASKGSASRIVRTWPW